MKTLRPALLVTGALLLATATASADPTPISRGVRGSYRPVNPYPGYVSEIYADPANWLCRPDTDDVCDHDLDATVVSPNGDTRTERFRPARHPTIDCFYVYPTISMDETGNSDLVPDDDEELFVVRQQAARLGAVCRVFAPVYRQVTLTALIANLGGGGSVPVDRELAYGDVVDAFKHYVANDSEGRGFLLIGHSQGAGHLTALIRNEIDPDPALRDRLVSAMLLGTSLQVLAGKDIGADFQNVPLCHKRDDVGCAIAYASFRSTAPPPPNSLFGGAREDGWQAACVNPASLLGGSGPLEVYLPTNGQALPILAIPPSIPWVDPALGVEITTPFVTLPGLFTARCAEWNGFTYLGVTVHADPDDPRIDDTTGADLTPEWGLHLIDANIAMGDLVSIARSQARSWCSRHFGCRGADAPSSSLRRRLGA
jgi:hypothetical protein